MKKIANILTAGVLLISGLLLPGNSKNTVAIASGGVQPEYVSPMPGGKLIKPETTIALRTGDVIDPASLESQLFSVQGSTSGQHTGTAVLADDHMTVIFKPDHPFALGEQVQVTINAGLRTASGKAVDKTSFHFTITPRIVNLSPQQALAMSLDLPNVGQSPQPAASGGRLPNYITLPPDYPTITVTTPASNTAAGYIFLTPVNWGGGAGYLQILNDNGDPLYYRRYDGWALDLKKQNNGTLTYYADGVFHAIDNTYTEVDTYGTGNGYLTDVHELQVLPNGHALLMSYDNEPVDMSQIVPGGDPTALVTGLIIQEIDDSKPTKNVVFQWRSWDHFLITDTNQTLTNHYIDYVHGNAIEQDTDGNILISSRNLSEITKINRQTGDIIWRLGGKRNQFTFINDTPPYFAYQHDIRRLLNGHISLFDNFAASQPPFYSEGVEFQLDEVNKTATLVWNYRNTPDAFGFAMGNVQRLSDGHTMIGYGSGAQATEVNASGAKAIELKLGAPYASYRAFRFTWQGFPTTQPSLIMQTGVVTSTLTYSWNGATEIGSYRVYGGDTPQPTSLITTQPKTGFETHTVVPTQIGCFYYRVMPLDIHNAPTTYSNEVATCTTGTSIYLPISLR